jgi:deoxyribonuclease V
VNIRQDLPPDLTRWDVDPRQAVQIQRELAKRVDVSRALPPVRLLAATDISFDVGGTTAFAAVVVVSLETGAVVERRYAEAELTFPYVPGLLSFRELPSLLEALAAVESTPDVILCDGQGVAHPRRIGIASHLGVLLGVPAFGCAKSKLCGSYEEPGPERGARSPLIHRGETIGFALRTRTRVAPVYVSAGHLCRHEDAEALVLATASRYRLPDPQREAHRYANERRRAASASASEMDRELKQAEADGSAPALQASDDSTAPPRSRRRPPAAPGGASASAGWARLHGRGPTSGPGPKA